MQGQCLAQWALNTSRNLVQPGAEKAVCYCTTGSIHFSLFGLGDTSFSLLAIFFRSEASKKLFFNNLLSKTEEK